LIPELRVEEDRQNRQTETRAHIKLPR